MSGRTFEYLLGRFTEPAEIFGPVDLRRLREGVVEVNTAGMLPEADVAFLDEVFLGSTAILNTLLGILNERRFKKGSTSVQCPLRVCIGASNELPTERSLQAFADRFLLRSFVDSVSDPRLEELLAGGRAASKHVSTRVADFAVVDVLADAARDVDLDAVRPAIAHAVRALRTAGVQLSDRRIVKLQGLVAAAAVIDGRVVASAADLWPIIYAVPTSTEQQIAREALRGLLERADNGVLPMATLEATQSLQVKARLLIERGAQLFATTTTTEPLAQASWRLRLEGIAREIDATFDTVPADLAELRTRIKTTLSSVPSDA